MIMDVVYGDARAVCTFGNRQKMYRTIISSTGSFDSVMRKKKICCGSDRPHRNAILQDLPPPSDKRWCPL
jgi:hypothetical protein